MSKEFERVNKIYNKIREMRDAQCEIINSNQYNNKQEKDILCGSIVAFHECMELLQAQYMTLGKSENDQSR